MDHHNVSAKLKSLASYGQALMRQGTEKLSKLNYKGYRITPVHVGVGAVAVALAVVALIAQFIKKYQSQIHHAPGQSSALLIGDPGVKLKVPDPKPAGAGQPPVSPAVPKEKQESVPKKAVELENIVDSSDVEEPFSGSGSGVEEQSPDLELEKKLELVGSKLVDSENVSDSSSVEEQSPRLESEANKLELVVEEEVSIVDRQPPPPPNLAPPKVFKVGPLQVRLQKGIEQRLQKKAQDTMAEFLPKIAEVAREADSQEVASLAAEARVLLDIAQSEGWHKKVYQGYQVQRHLRDLITTLELHQVANEFTETNRKSLEILKSSDASPLLSLRRSLEYLGSCRRFIADLNNEKESVDEKDNLKKLDNLYIGKFGTNDVIDKEIDFVLKNISNQLENLKFTGDTYKSLSILAKSFSTDSEGLQVITEWLTRHKDVYDRELRISKAYNDAISRAMVLSASAEMSGKEWMDCVKTLVDALDEEKIDQTESREVGKLLLQLAYTQKLEDLKNHPQTETKFINAYLSGAKRAPNIASAPQLAALSVLVQEFITRVEPVGRAVLAMHNGIAGTQALLKSLEGNPNSIEDHEGKFKKLYSEYAQLSTDHFELTLPWKASLDHCRAELDTLSFNLGHNAMKESVVIDYREPSQAPVIDEKMILLLSNRGLDGDTKKLMAKNLSRLGEMKGSGTAEEQESETWIYTGASGEKVELKTRAFPEELAARYVVCFQGSDQGETTIDSANVELDREKWAGLIEQALPGVGCSAEPPMIAGVLNSLWREGGLAQTWLKSNQVINRANQTNTQLRLTQDEVIRVDIKLEKDDLVITHQVNYGLGLQDHSTGQATPLDAHAVHILTSRIPLNDSTKISVEWQAQPFKPDEKMPLEAVKAEAAEPQLQGKGVRLGDSLIEDTEDLRKYLEELQPHELRDYKYALSLQAAQKKFPKERLDTPLGGKVEELRAILNSNTPTHYKRYAAFRSALMVILDSQDYKDQRDLAIKAKEEESSALSLSDYSFVMVEHEDKAFKYIMDINFARYRDNKMDLYTEVLVERALIAGRAKLALPALPKSATPAQRIEDGIKCMKAAGQTEMGESPYYVKLGKFKGYTNVWFDSAGDTNVLFPWPKVEIYGEKRAWLRFGTPTAGAVVNPDMIAYTDELELRGEKHAFFNLQDRNPKRMSHPEYWTGSPERARSLAIEKELNAKKSCFAVTLPHDTDFFHQRGQFANEEQAGTFKASLMWEMNEPNGGFYFPPSLTGESSADKREFLNGLGKIFDDVHQYVYDGKKTLTAEERRNFIEIAYVFIILKILVASGATSFNISCKDAIDRGGVLNALMLFVIAVLNGEDVSSPAFQKKLDTFTHGPAFVVKTQGVLSSRSPQLLGPLKQLFERREVLQNSPLKMEYLQQFRPEYLENPKGKAKPLGGIIEGIVTYALKNPERSEGSPYERADKLLNEVIEIIPDPKVRDPLLDYAKRMLDSDTRLVAPQDDTSMVGRISKEIDEISDGIFKLFPEVPHGVKNIHSHGPDGRKANANYAAEQVNAVWGDHRKLTLDEFGGIVKSPEELERILNSSKQLLDRAGNLINSPEDLKTVTGLDEFYRLLKLQLKNLNSALVSAGSKVQQADPFKALSGRAEKLSEDLKTKRKEQLVKVPASEEAEASPSSEYLKIQLQYDLVQGVRKVVGRTYDSLFADCYVKKYFAPYAEGIKDPRKSYDEPRFYTNLVAEMEMGPMDQPDLSIQNQVINAFDKQTKALYKKIKRIDSKEQIKSSPDRKEWETLLSAAWEREGFPGQIRRQRAVNFL